MCECLGAFYIFCYVFKFYHRDLTDNFHFFGRLPMPFGFDCSVFAVSLSVSRYHFIL